MKNKSSTGCWPLFGNWTKQKLQRIRVCQLAVVGDQGSGKTSLIFRFSRDRVPRAGEEVKAVLDSDVLDVWRDGKQVRLVVNDTSGEEEDAKVRALTYHEVDALIVCLPLDCPESLGRMYQDWVPEIRHLCQDKPCVLVGTKKDLRDTAKAKSPREYKELFITKTQGKQAAKALGAVAYVECSALDIQDGSKRVKRVFGRALRESLQRQL